MYFEQIYLGCLAHASYIFGSNGEAAVVDPQRDVDIYIEAARKQNLEIRHIFETHLHADFVSGHKELAERTGATIYIGIEAGAKFPHVDVRDGSKVNVGNIQVEVLETPGHTSESICLVLTDTEASEKPFAVLTGDTLFIGDVGRPDLSRKHTPQQLAGLLYDSLHGKLLKLGDNVLVYPAHGAGSLCGRQMRDAKSSTIGTERLTNAALQIKTRDEFITQLTANLPVKPEYFLQDADLNREGASALSEMSALQAISPADLENRMRDGQTVLDVRTADLFAAGHVPGSINIPLSGQFASWAGIVLGLDTPLILVAENLDEIHEARIRLARVGIEKIHGYLDGGVAEWKRTGRELVELPQMNVDELEEHVGAANMGVLDVRREAEWLAGHIDNASWYPLDKFKASLPAIEAKGPLAVHCKSGYRSAIACSLLQRAGFDVINVVGGFDAWQQHKSTKAAQAASARS